MSRTSILCQFLAVHQALSGQRSCSMPTAHASLAYTSSHPSCLSIIALPDPTKVCQILHAHLSLCPYHYLRHTCQGPAASVSLKKLVRHAAGAASMPRGWLAFRRGQGSQQHLPAAQRERRQQAACRIKLLPLCHSRKLLLGAGPYHRCRFGSHPSRGHESGPKP